MCKREQTNDQKLVNGFEPPYTDKRMFNEALFESAKDVMKRLMMHPISIPFRDPIGDDAPDYYKIIKNPQYLLLIVKNLEDMKYKKIQEWYDDVETVWKNAEIYHGEKSHFAIAAAENRKIFKKERASFEANNLSSWCNLVYETRTYITDLMNQLPAKIKQLTDSIGTARPMRKFLATPSEQDVNNFLNATSMISSDEDHLEMIKIIKEMQPELDNGLAVINIDVSRLNEKTFSALRNFVKSSLSKQGAKYPE